jgi:acyl-coenzyme A thioesterase PaaI-like protein
VTIKLNISFLRKPAQRDLAAEAPQARQRLATGEVVIRCVGEDVPVAHTTSTIQSRWSRLASGIIKPKN